MKELLSKKGEFGEASLAPIEEVILQSMSPSKLQDLDSFSIPCCIGDMQIETVLCDLGVIVSLMCLSLSLSLSLCRKL